MTISEPDQQSRTKEQSQPSQRGVAGNPQRVLPFVPLKFAYAIGDPQEGNLATPVNSSKLTRWFINQLPAYRQGLSPFQRGLHIGLSHGFWLLGPFVALGPLRETSFALLAGLVSAIGVVIIATLSLIVYAASAPPPPIATPTTPNPPAALSAPQGWHELARGFVLGGTAGVIFAAALLLIFGSALG